MRTAVPIVLLLLQPAWLAHAAASADELFERIRAAAPASRAAGAPNPTPAEERRHYLEMNTRADEQIALTLEFAAKFPADPRRAELLLNLADSPVLNYQFKSVGEDVAERGLAAVVFDQERIDRLRAQTGALVARLIDDAAASPALREKAAAWWALAPARSPYDYALRRAIPPTQADLAEARRRIDATRAKFPAATELAAKLEQSFHRSLAKLDAAAAKASLARLSADPAPAVAEWAARQARVAEFLGRPIELKFTALDGREVDLAALRGKVVLIDFWATWCRPCLAEMPNVKRVLAANRRRGFEVVGVALENARLAPGDSPAQREEKIAAARKLLADTVAREKLDWPHAFDATVQPNPLAERFGVTAIPATFLLDRSGRVAETELKGPALAEAVERLLTP